MKIFFLTLVYPNSPDDRNLYSDLFDEVASRGHDVTVFRPDETRYSGKPWESMRGIIRIVNIPTGRITKTRGVLKAFNMSFIKSRYLSAVLGDLYKRPDLIVYSTPPINFVQVVETLKAKTGCATYLLLKDIFPQNAVDLKMLHSGSFIHTYFRNKEKRLYAVSDRIGCMSPANVQYILKHNPEIVTSKVHVNPNSIRPTPIYDISVVEKSNLDNYNIPINKFHLVYGGNLGKPQGIKYFLKALTALSSLSDVYTTIVGDGTEYRCIADYISQNELKSITLIKTIPIIKYQALLLCMDVGLIFLDSRFTIPNFPSRILDYMDMSLPIITATDEVTDIGHILFKAGAGLMCKSCDTEGFLSCVKKIKDDGVLKINMAKASRALLINEYSIALSADKILSI